MLLDGSSIDQPSPGPDKSKVTASIGQQIIFNSVRLRCKNPCSVPRHIRKNPTYLYAVLQLQLSLRPPGFEFRICVWRAVSSHSSHHHQDIFQFSLYVHNGGLKPHSFHFILLQTMHQRVSYDRLKKFSTDVTNSTVKHWDGLVSLFHQRPLRVFSLYSGFNYIFHNPSSITATSAFHGACISNKQHFTSEYQQCQNFHNMLDPVEIRNM